MPVTGALAVREDLPCARITKGCAMTNVREVAENIYEVHPELNFMFSLSYLVMGKFPALIDPGSSAQARIVLQTLEQKLGLDPAALRYIIPTHLHIDHAGGAGLVAQRAPQARILVMERQARHLSEPSRLIEANRQTFGENFADTFGPIISVPGDRVLPLRGGETIDIGGRTLEVIFSPGHAHHHFCLFDDRTRGLFSGDALGMYYPEVDGVVIICPEGFDLDVALRTIEDLRRRRPALVFYAHEGTGRSPEELMNRAAREIRECGKIILEAEKSGKSPAQMEALLSAYFRETVSPKLRYERMYLGLTVAGYRRYFAKAGLVPARGEKA